MMNGEQLFRTFCVERNGAWSGQFRNRADARRAQEWARANLPGRCTIRTTRNFIHTLGMVYTLKVV
jgi:hypothetical protein